MAPLELINKLLKDEHGNPVTADSKWMDAGVDSFGTTIVFCDLDNEYACFNREWLSTVVWSELTIKDLLDRIASTGKAV